MARLIYAAITSLDGYVADEDGEFGWAEPDAEVHSFVNDLERQAGTSLYGRRMYEVLRVWEGPHSGQPAHIEDYARIWQATDKVVYSTTLTSVSTARTRLERVFDPDAVRELKATAEHDITIGGPGLASHAFAAGLVDECHAIVAPASVGGGTRFLPANLRLDLELLDERRFGSGFVYLRYAVR